MAVKKKTQTVHRYPQLLQGLFDAMAYSYICKASFSRFMIKVVGLVSIWLLDLRGCKYVLNLPFHYSTLFWIMVKLYSKLGVLN